MREVRDGAARGSSFGSELRRLREAAGLSQEELAERAGLTSRAISSLERGERKRPYPHTVRALADALGLSDERRAQLAATAHGGDAAPAPDPPSPSLPSPPTPIVGRERELVEVLGILRSGARLVTLVGPGGVGKTRLALEAARAVARTFPDGVVLVALAPLGDPRLVVATVARALGLREGGQPPLRDVLHAHLRARSLLLVLDNCEHVLDAAPEVADLLATCPSVAVLATSRAPLRLRGEREYPVGPLTVPATDRVPSVVETAEVPAVDLFVARVRDVSPDFELTPANVAAVAAICRRLDGLPLALELAAARVRSLPPATLLVKLDRALPLLSGGARDLPDRQRTMAAAIGWSYDLVEPGEARLFRRLSVFAGGWDPEAVEAVGAGEAKPEAVPGTLWVRLDRLVEQSLVLAEPVADGAIRYRMLEPVRQYARERLAESGEAEEVGRRHADQYAALALRAGRELRGAGQVEWMGRLDREHDNLRVALGWLLERGETERVVGIGWGLWWFWFMRGFLTEGRQWMDRALMQDAALPAGARARALTVVGGLAFAGGDYDRAAVALDEGGGLARDAGDSAVLATALQARAFTAVNQGDHARAAAWADESAGLHRALGDRSNAGVALLAAVHAAVGEGDLARADRLLDASEALARASGAPFSIASALNVRVMLAQIRGDAAQTVALLRESLSLSRALHDVYALGNGLIGLGSALTALGRGERAARLFGAAEALREATGTAMQYPGRRAVYERQVAALRERLDPQTFAAAWAAGRALPLDAALAEALDESA